MLLLINLKSKRRGRCSPVATLAPCGTYAHYGYALRERTAGRPHCGPCEACCQARRDYDNARSTPEILRRSTDLQGRRKYGINFVEKREIFKAQGSCCGLCKNPTPSQKLDWSIEHNHQTGEVRGVVCQYCNHLIGIAARIVGSEDPDQLCQLLGPVAIDYLRHGAARTHAVLNQLRSNDAGLV